MNKNYSDISLEPVDMVTLIELRKNGTNRITKSDTFIFMYILLFRLIK